MLKFVQNKAVLFAPQKTAISAFIKVFLSASIILALVSVIRAQQKAVIIMGELSVYAWTLEKAEDRIVASGEVELYYKQIKLFADRVEVDTKTKDALATGHVSLELPEEVVNCEKMSFNLDTHQGKLDQVLGRIQPSVLYEAASIERKADNLYSLEKANFTSCTQPTPRWKFSFSKADLKKGDYIEMRNAVFSIKKIPIFYWPYMRYPLDRQRATGFLMPQIGYSQIKGFSYSQGFYWAMARNMDATFSLDYYSAKGVGAGTEFRYIFNGGTGGDLHLYYFMFKSQPGQIKPENAYIIRWNHNQPLPGGFSLVANLDYQSSFQFLREFDNNLMRALVFNRSSQVYLSKSWSSYSFSIRAAQFETSFPLYSGSVVYKYLPQINFDSFKIKLFSPLYFSFSSSFNNWQYGWDSQYKTNSQLRNQEFNFSPALSLPFNAIPWLTLNFSLEGFLRYYGQSKKPGVGIVDEPVLTKNYAFNVDLIGPVLFRIWELGGNGGGGDPSTTRLKHIIEPSVTYRYESPIINAQKIFSPYGSYRYHQVTYGLTNHLLLKKEDRPKEILTWGIFQTFFISPQDSPMRELLIDGKIPQFSELENYIRFFPGAGFSLDLSASFNTYFKSLSSIRLGAIFGSPADDLFLNINWYKSMNPYYKNPWYDRHQISLFGGAKIPAVSLELTGEMDFNVTEKKMLYSALSAVYHYQCLDLKADVRIFYFREKPDMQFKISFGLGNIGKTTDFLGGARLD
ncbi:MAG: LPS assembly protein LptD [Candidatus Aminicenantes bacterium]|nr:LPS assembly protein LptD [Candidatus Aminicenantes bacterium]